MDFEDIVEDMEQPLEVEEVLSMADGKSLINPKRNREGLVFKEIGDEQRHWKAVSNEYLLKEK